MTNGELEDLLEETRQRLTEAEIGLLLLSELCGVPNRALGRAMEHLRKDTGRRTPDGDARSTVPQIDYRKAAAKAMAEWPDWPLGEGKRT